MQVAFLRLGDQMKNLEGDLKQKKPYTKPEVTLIDLRPEEAVLGNCKTSGSSGPGSLGNCKPVGNCSTQGS
jgi:hypothetical protein